MSSLKYTRPEAMIFDLDGTLFKTETVILHAYHRTFDTLREEGLHEGPTPPESRLIEGLGQLLHEIWDNVIPDGSAAAKDRANDLLVEYELEALQEGMGELYPKTEETLRKLKDQGIRLFVASNGLEPYVRGVVESFGLTPLFEEVYSAGEYDTPSKAELVRILREKHDVKTAWMVGDRSSDVEAGTANGFDVIGCNYANFGEGSELEGATVLIQSFSEILTLLD